MNAWLTTILIFLPVAGALACFLFPVGGGAVASFAVLVSLVEVGFWIDSVTRFNFSHGLQFEQRGSWFSDLHVSYHVGMFGFSLWLVGLTVVVMAAAIAYAFLAGRDRPRAYYGLMLLLTGAVVGVFTAQDLLLFYVMF
jgi:NADH:ubiquinone oxidoreductase subunit 4 (subunit M)